MARAARSGEFRDDIEDDILGFDARTQRAVDRNAHRAGFGLEDALAGEDHFDLRSPHAERHGAQSSVGRSVAVAADDRHARLGESQLGADDVHDALLGVSHAEVLDAVAGAVLGQRLDLPPRLRLPDRKVLVDGRDVMVGRGRDLRRTRDAEAAAFDPRESHGRRHLVDILPVDVEHAAAAVLDTHRVRVPYLVQKRSSHINPPPRFFRLR